MEDTNRSHRLERYRAAVDYIDREIVRLTPRRRDPRGKVAAALAFNRALGDPQRAYASIQVAGTSGKGSVAQLIAESLTAAGLATGCHLSPYLQAFTEKSWIDGRYCSVERLSAAVEELRPVAESFRLDDACPASVHGMASLGASYLAFRDAGVEMAVVETGLGGRFDLVQGLRRELTVITELGLDHTASLGPTLEEIAWHKAGVIEPGVPCVAARGAGWEVIAAEARRRGAPLIPVDLERVRPDDDGKLSLELETLGQIELQLGTRAAFVARNVALAAAALDALARAGRPVRTDHLARALCSRVPGRFERLTGSGEPAVILDCAHNPQKMAALAAALDTAGLERSTIVFTATGARLAHDLLAPLAERTDLLIATELALYGKSTLTAAEVGAAARGCGLETRVEPSPERALDLALERTAPGGAVVVTGSIYLVGRLRDRWFSTDEVVLQGTSWPTPARIGCTA